MEQAVAREQAVGNQRVQVRGWKSRYLAARIGIKVRNGSPLSETETRFVKERGLTPAAENRARR